MFQTDPQELAERIMRTLAGKLRSVEGIEMIQVDVATIPDIAGMSANNISTFGNVLMKEEITKYFAICRNGEVLNSPPPRCVRRSDWQYIGNKDEPGVLLGTAWDEWLDGIKYVLEYSLYKNVRPKERSCDLVMYVVADEASPDVKEYVWERLGMEIPLPCL
ncbi:MAG: hypothetical protein PHT88_01955 [Candidatus Moranbacteria bacterium]|nr:hypothetical protein [Candidatus Moranbacteria bacterium]